MCCNVLTRIQLLNVRFYLATNWIDFRFEHEPSRDSFASRAQISHLGLVDRAGYFLLQGAETCRLNIFRDAADYTDRATRPVEAGRFPLAFNCALYRSPVFRERTEPPSETPPLASRLFDRYIL